MRIAICVLALCAACASAKKNDGPPAKAALEPAREVVSGGGELRGGTIRMAATVGGPVGPRGKANSPATTTRVQSAGAVHP